MLKIKAKKDYTVDKRNLKKVLKDENTVVICESFFTDDYQYDVMNNFGYEIIKNTEMLEDIENYFHIFCTQAKKDNTIELINSFSSYVIKNDNLIIEFNS